jgi:preprotein translocase subunit SecA
VQLGAKDFRNSTYSDAERLAVEEATRMAEGQVLDAIEENLPDGEDESEWNWAALASVANSRWNLNLRDRDLKKIGRDDVSEELIKLAGESIHKVDLSPCARYLDHDYGVRTACQWMRDKFGAVIPVEEVKDLDATKFTQLAHQRASEAYDRREAEYAVIAALNRFSPRGSDGERQNLLREDLVEWAKRRFDVDLTVDDLKSKQRDEIRELLVAHSQKNNEKANQVAAEAQERVEKLFAGESSHAATLGAVTGQNGKLDDLTTWLKNTCQVDVSRDELSHLDRDEAARKISQLVEDHFRPEMRRLERSLLLSILDSSWKEHLLTMDHLKSSVGLRGYAQVDPKVEFKREGMSMFENLWVSIGHYVTDWIFQMEQLDDNFVSSTWVGGTATKEEAKPVSEIEQQQQSAIAGTEAEKKLEPIRNMGPRVGRNDPCPCGSGKKYKQCCMKKE